MHPTHAKTRTQKLFRNGGSQAVRIPKEMSFHTKEVRIHREGDRLVIEPKATTLRSLSRQMGNPLEWDWEPADPKTAPEAHF
ncbi:MAG: antitoxin [Opitutales bacterium]